MSRFVWKAFTLWRTHQGVRPSPIVNIMYKILLVAVVVYDRLVNRSFQNNRGISIPYLVLLLLAGLDLLCRTISCTLVKLLLIGGGGREELYPLVMRSFLTYMSFSTFKQQIILIVI